MTQEMKNEKKTAELHALFMSLDKQGQEMALSILKSLDFAQSVMCRQTDQATEEKRLV